MNSLHRVSSVRVFILLLAALSLVATACKKGTTTSQTSGGVTPEATEEAAEVQQSVGKPPDMCKVVAVAELESAMGGGKFSNEIAGEPNEKQSECSWDVSYNNEESPSTKLNLNYQIDQNFDQSAYPGAEPVEGVGKRAIWSSSVSTLANDLGGGDVFLVYTLGIHGAATQEEATKLAKDHAISVAKLVLQKL